MYNWLIKIDPNFTGRPWKCSAFHRSNLNVDKREPFVREDDIYDFKIDFMDTSITRRHTDMKVSSHWLVIKC